MEFYSSGLYLVLSLLPRKFGHTSSPMDTNVSTFTLLCFAIPIVSFAKTIIATRSYLEGVADGIDMAPRKKRTDVWKMRDGREILLTSMSDNHLANAIKMVARNCHKPGYLGKMQTDNSFKKLVREAERRKFIISTLNTPNQNECVNVYIPPHTRSKISAGFFPSDWDSRPQE